MVSEESYDGTESFWAYIARNKNHGDFDDELLDARIEKRQKLMCTKGYGISYEWITQPSGWRSSPREMSGYFHWGSVDGYFQGVPRDEFDRVLGQFQSSGIEFERGIKYYYGKKMDQQEMPYYCNCFSGDDDHDVHIPDHLFSNSNIPTPQEMEGTYDIIYYGGRSEWFFGMHYRTARGTVRLSRGLNSNGKAVVEGSVKMHQCMRDIDVIPYGGEFSFIETARLQRLTYPDDYFPGDTSQPSGVIKMELTKGPAEVCKRSIWGDEFIREGELRIFREKTATRITNQVPLEIMNSEDQPTSNFHFNSTEEAEALNREHYKNTCSWLHKYTVLDKALAMHVGKFVCPPPILFFMEGDIQIDIDWKNVAPQAGHGCNTCIIARRQTSAAATRVLSDKTKYERELSSVKAEMATLESKSDMIWLAFKCSEMLRECAVDGDSPPTVVFMDDNEDCGRIQGCLQYLDRDYFDKQLSLYVTLRLERIEYIPDHIPDLASAVHRHQLHFSWV